MPFEVAPAPLPSWDGGPANKSEGGAKPAGASFHAASKPHGLDAAFLCRLHLTLLWFGAVSIALVAQATAPGGRLTAFSFAGGFGLGWALLGAQSFVVSRTLVPSRRGSGASAGKPKMLWWLLVPLKYLAVAALLGWAIGEAKLSPAWLALGFGMVQFILLAKVAGKVLNGSVKTVRQAYVEPGK